MAGLHYVADPPELRRCVELDGLTALFHLRSGMTHILAAPAPQILDVLSEGPASIETILARLSNAFDLESGEGAIAILEARLAELEAAGLVWRE